MDVREIVDIMLPAASAAYDAMGEGAFALPAGFSLVGRIEMEPIDILGAEMPRYAIENTVFGYVAYRPQDATALVSFRGTRTKIEWVADFEALPAAVSLFGPELLFHSGMLAVYSAIRKSTNDLLASVKEIKKTLITGHSLGGALATLRGLECAHCPFRLCCELVTFESPRVLGANAAGFFGHLGTKLTRIVNHGDIVPDLPPPGVYEHPTGDAVSVLNVDSGLRYDFKDLSVNGYRNFLSSVHGLIAVEAGLKKLLA